VTPDIGPDTLFGRLRAACIDDWQAYTRHAFVRALADGTLAEPCFRHYLGQDYLFLIHFARAYALAAYKADTMDDIRQAAAALGAIIDVEMDLHVKFCAGWGLSETDMAALPEAEATMAYTRYVLEKGLSGDLLDLHVALAPCVVGDAEIGAELMADAETKFDGNPYRDWIEMYASADFQEVARAEVAHMDRLMERRGGPGRMAALTTTFRQATRLEAAFWDMGLNP
jgi:thiaminase/transcriptional activator TenA